MKCQVLHKCQIFSYINTFIFTRASNFSFHWGENWVSMRCECLRLAQKLLYIPAPPCSSSLLSPLVCPTHTKSLAVPQADQFSHLLPFYMQFLLSRMLFRFQILQIPSCTSRLSSSDTSSREVLLVLPGWVSPSLVLPQSLCSCRTTDLLVFPLTVDMFVSLTGESEMLSRYFPDEWKISPII